MPANENSFLKSLAHVKSYQLHQVIQYFLHLLMEHQSLHNQPTIATSAQKLNTFYRRLYHLMLLFLNYLRFATTTTQLFAFVVLGRAINKIIRKLFCLS